MNFLFDTYFEKFNTNTDNFERLDTDFSVSYQVNKQLSIFVKSKSLLNLLGIRGNNTAEVLNNSSNGINIKTINNSILGYLLTGVQFKF